MYKSIIETHHKIKLEEESHTYTLSNSNVEFQSVTEFIGVFFQEFDEEKIARKLIQTKKYAQMSIKDILNDWKERRDRGTIIHQQIEHFLLSKNYNQNTNSLDEKSKQGICFLKEKCIPNTDNYLFPEIKICSEKLQIAGTIDLLIYNKKNHQIYLVDWKTNLAIKKSGYKKGLKYPTTTIEDCNYNKYRLQLSMYKYILEKFYLANVGGLYILHLKDNEYDIINCEYQNQMIIEMLKVEKNIQD